MRMTRILIKLLALLFVAGLLTGCAGGPKTVWDGPPQSEAEAAYRDALSLKESGQYIESSKRFNALRLKYPFSSRWTTLAELRLADILLEQSRYTAAAEAYRQFVQAHPTHEEVPYAEYKVGEAYYEQMPSDIFILPDPWQRELNSARMAELSLARFLERHPDSEYAEDATEKLSEVRERLAQHQLYVAEFYIKRESPHGAMNRLLILVNQYPDSSVAGDALFLLAQAYAWQKDITAAASALTRLLESYGDNDYAQEAQEWLEANGLTDVAPMPLGQSQ